MISGFEGGKKIFLSYKSYQASFFQREVHSWRVSDRIWTVSIPPGGEGSVPLNTLSASDGMEAAPAWWLAAFPTLGSLGLAMPHLLLLSCGAGCISDCALLLRELWEEARRARSRRVRRQARARGPNSSGGGTGPGRVGRPGSVHSSSISA